MRDRGQILALIGTLVVVGIGVGVAMAFVGGSESSSDGVVGAGL